MSQIVFLGPQRMAPTLKRTMDSLGIRGPIAAITAGWEERESDDSELSDHLGGRTTNLRLYARIEEVFKRDPELFEAMRERHDAMRLLQELYRQRLAHAHLAARELLSAVEDNETALSDLYGPEIDHAISALRNLDAHHLKRVLAVHAEFEERMRPLERPEVVRHREELARELKGAEALCIAGGHVAILLNRLRLLGLMELWGDRPVIAWSAGAMVLSERIVLFHDSPPQGAGNAEVLEVGLGCVPGVVPLPHAKKRLRLDDGARVALFARRFAPALCVALDGESRIDWNGSELKLGAGTRALSDCGELEGSAA